ncbi:MAG: hypothetical protein ACKVG2_02915, partial [Candidatus Poseidoniales archaeon]
MIDRLLSSQGEDRILLLSGGPDSHLAKRSMFAKGMTKRLVITQPPITPQRKHSPLGGETIISTQKKPMEGTLQSLTEQGWAATNILNAMTVEAMLRALKPHTPTGAVWAGALSYDLVQWTQPISLQHPPVEGEILAILWLVEQWDEGEVINPEVSEAIRVEGEISPHSDEEHAAIVLKIKDSITAGELY